MNGSIRGHILFRMGVLRGALSERIRHADEMLKHADSLESLAIKGEDPEGVEAALGELETLAGVRGPQTRKRVYHGQETASG